MHAELFMCNWYAQFREKLELFYVSSIKIRWYIWCFVRFVYWLSLIESYLLDYENYNSV